MKFENISKHKYATIKNAPTKTIYYIYSQMTDQEIKHYLLQNKSVSHLSHTIPPDSVFAVTLRFDFHH